MLMYLVHGTCIFHIVIVFETYNIRHIKKKKNIYTCLYNIFQLFNSYPMAGYLIRFILIY